MLASFPSSPPKCRESVISGLDWTELDWTGLTFCTNCIHDTKHASIQVVLEVCVKKYAASSSRGVGSTPASQAMALTNISDEKGRGTLRWAWPHGSAYVRLVV